MQRHLLGPGGKLPKLLVYGFPHREFTDKLLYPSGPPANHTQMWGHMYIQNGFTGTKGEAVLSTPQNHHHTAMSHAAIHPMAHAAHMGCGEGWAVQLGLGDEPGEAIRLKREAGEKAGRLVRTEAGWQTLSHPCAKLQ